MELDYLGFKRIHNLIIAVIPVKVVLIFCILASVCASPVRTLCVIIDADINDVDIT